MSATEPDRRILMLLALAALFSLTLFGKALLPARPVDATAGPSALQLRQDGGELAVCRSRDCRSLPDPEGTRPQLAPLFFQPIPINRADAGLLETIDGIGPHLASEIIRVRDQEGVVFRSGEDLLQVPGIGRKRARQLESQFSYSEAP